MQILVYPKLPIESKYVEIILIAGIRNMLTDEMYRFMQGEADDLKKNKRINRLENIAVRAVELSEAWQEAGKDFITVRFLANLLHYTTDKFYSSPLNQGQ